MFDLQIVAETHVITPRCIHGHKVRIYIYLPVFLIASRIFRIFRYDLEVGAGPYIKYWVRVNLWVRFQVDSYVGLKNVDFTTKTASSAKATCRELASGSL